MFDRWKNILVILMVSLCFAGTVLGENNNVILVKADNSYPPFEFINEKGQPDGFTIDIMNAISAEMGRTINIQSGVWEDIITELKSGQIDALSGMYKTQKRDVTFDFTIPHFIASYAVFVRKNSGVKGIQDLNDKVILVQNGDLGHDYLIENEIGKKIIPMKNWKMVLLTLASGKADAALISRLQGKKQIVSQGIKNLKVVGPPIIQRKYCIAVKKGNSDLLAELNEGLSIIKTTGKYDQIYTKWFGVYEKEPVTFWDVIKYLGWIVLPILGLTCIVSLWSWTLKRQVKRKTRELKGELIVRKKLEWERQTLTEQLQEKNKELEQIIFVSSHDLRSPLVNVQGFSKELNESIKGLNRILERASLEENIRKDINQLINEDISEAIYFIQGGISKMDGLLSALLKFSRSGRSALVIKPLNMDDVVKENLNSFKFQIKEQNVSIKVNPLPACIADKAQINHVFSNLLDNALKFTEPSRQAEIELGGFSENGRSVYYVKDNGIGIAKEHQKKIFEIFYRLNPKQKEGQGLGMTIVKKVLSRMDGKVWIESDFDKGATFFFSLPSSNAFQM